MEIREMFYGYACNMTYMADYRETSRMQVLRNSFKFAYYFSNEVAFIILPGLHNRKYFFRKCRCIMGNEVQTNCLSWR